MAFDMTPAARGSDSAIGRLNPGFAAAVLPVSATTITTDSAGLVAGEVEIPAGDIRVPGYRAMPAQGTAFPTVLVVQEIFGVHEHIKDVCRRLAKSGYLAIAPSLYERQGDVSGIEDVQELYTKVVMHVPDAQVISDLDATVAWAEKNHGNTGRLAITGFCWGGRIVWLYAAHSPKLKAAAAWYGRLTNPKTPAWPKHPIDIAGDLKAPVIGFYGGQDAGIPLDTVEAMRDAIKAAGKPAEIIVYPQAQHGFYADYRPNYNAAAATDAWEKMLAFFRQHGV
jgi:carboxymethylenebutenolidase